jgi:hypothetical protein
MYVTKNLLIMQFKLQIWYIFLQNQSGLPKRPGAVNIFLIILHQTLKNKIINREQLCQDQIRQIKFNQNKT